MGSEMCIRDSYYTYREWKTLQELYHNQEYEQAASRYAGLFVQLYHRTDFLYEGAECFYKTGQHDIAIKWLDRALKLSAAPELYYAIAKTKRRSSNTRKRKVTCWKSAGFYRNRDIPTSYSPNCIQTPLFYIRTNSIKQPRGFSPSSPVHKTT